MTTYQRISLKSQIAPHFWQTFKSKARHQIDKGGRGSAKTSKNALKVVYHLKLEPCAAVLLRQHQNTLRNSVYKEVKRALARLGMVEHIDYKALKSPMEIRLVNGSVVYFAGGDDYENIKGMIDESLPVKLIWFNELTGWDSDDELEQIIATFTRGNDDWFVTLYDFNPPKNRYHWVNGWTDRKQSEGAQVIHTDYRTVPQQWLGSIFLEEAERLKRFDEKRYRWIYLGEVIGLEGQVYDISQIQTMDELPQGVRVVYVDYSIDGGHQSSATTCLAFGYLSNHTRVLLDTYYYSPKEKAKKKAPSELTRDIWDFQARIASQYKAPIDKETIDSAEGALRNQMFADYGKRLNPVNKGYSKEQLIDYSQAFLADGRFYVMANPNNKIFLLEMRDYRYKEGSIERGKPEPDKTEHQLASDKVYHNTHAQETAYYYADHTVDAFQYYVKDNLRKLGLKF